MTVTLSTKGQLVIPKEIRKTLALRPGTKFSIEVNQQRQIVLQPIPDQEEHVHNVIDSLRGILAGTDALEWLEEDHRQELQREETRLRL